MKKLTMNAWTLLSICIACLLAGCEAPQPPQSAKPPKIISASPLPDAMLNQGYSFTLQAVQGTRPLQWSSNNLPKGLKLNLTTGEISGRPIDQGATQFDVTVTDSATPPRSQHKTFSLTIRSSQSSGLFIETASPLQVGVLGQAYQQLFKVSGGTGPFTWSAKGLYEDFSLDRNTGILKGNANVAGEFSFDVVVTDSKGDCADKRFIFNIVELLSIATPPRLQDAIRGKRYRAGIDAQGGRLPLSWTASNLPEPFSLDQQSDHSIMITGIPDIAEEFSFDLTVRDSSNQPQSVSKTFFIKVTDQAPVCQTHEVTMEAFQFMPATLTVNSCDTVVWMHKQGQTPHTVTSGPFGSGAAGDTFDSRAGDANARMFEGAEFSHKFVQAGTFDYHCVVHGSDSPGGMNGTITVSPSE